VQRPVRAPRSPGSTALRRVAVIVRHPLVFGRLPPGFTARSSCVSDAPSPADGRRAGRGLGPALRPRGDDARRTTDDGRHDHEERPQTPETRGWRTMTANSDAEAVEPGEPGAGRGVARADLPLEGTPRAADAARVCSGGIFSSAIASRSRASAASTLRHAVLHLQLWRRPVVLSVRGFWIEALSRDRR